MASKSIKISKREAAAAYRKRDRKKANELWEKAVQTRTDEKISKIKHVLGRRAEQFDVEKWLNTVSEHFGNRRPSHLLQTKASELQNGVWK